MIKNPKKNYSLKGKSLSTKIAFVVICVFIFSLFIGSIGGLVYLFKSFSDKPFAVSAEGVGGSEETIYDAKISLNVAGIDYTATNVRTADNELCDFDQFLFYLPLTVHSRTVNGQLTALSLESFYFDNNNRIVSEIIPFINVGSPTVFNYGCFAYKIGAFLNVGLVIETIDSSITNPGFGGIVEISTCEFEFFSGVNSSAVLKITLYDNYGGSILFHIYPYNRGDFVSLNPETRFSSRYVYEITPFNENAIKASYDKGFREGVSYSKADNQTLVTEAYDKGFNAGKERGKIEGAASASNYSFASLLDAVFYAPVKMFVSLFNFDFLGVNVLGFVSTIITVIIAFGIIKFFL